MVLFKSFLNCKYGLTENPHFFLLIISLGRKSFNEVFKIDFVLPHNIFSSAGIEKENSTKSLSKKGTRCSTE